MFGRNFLTAAVAAAVLAAASAAHAGSVLVGQSNWSGTRTTADGIVGLSGWSHANGGLSISWNITYNAGVFTYKYTFANADGSPLSKSVSHFNIETSSTFTDANVLDGSDGDIEGPKTHTGAGNPDMPGNLYGIKFDFGGSNPTYTLVTDRAPIWGDFYAKDGKTNGKDNVAYNVGFGTDPTALTTDFTNWVATPDTLTYDPNDPGTPVPLPSAALAGMAMLGVMGLRRLRRN